MLVQEGCVQEDYGAMMLTFKVKTRMNRNVTRDFCERIQRTVFMARQLKSGSYRFLQRNTEDLLDAYVAELLFHPHLHNYGVRQ